MYARHDCHILPDPHIVADDSVTFERQFIHYRRNRTAPVSSHYVERIGGGTVHPMVGPIHNESNPLGNGAKVTDYQPVTDEFLEVCDVFLKPVGTVRIIVISIVANDYSRILHHILYVAKARN